MHLKNILRASFLVTLKGHKHRYVHIGNVRIHVGVQGVWNPLENNKFYSKKQLGPITLEKVGPPDIFDPPLLVLWKNYSVFEINIGPPL